jgi:hypothetical protein
MIPDLLPLLLAASDQPQPLIEPARFGNFTLVWMILIGMSGCAVLAWCLAPDRQRLAIDRLADRPALSFGIGLLLLALLAIAVTAAHRAGWTDHGGGITTLLPFILCAGGGLGVSARALGERAAPESPPPTQLAIGLVATILPGIALVGLPITVLAAALGLGAWLRAKSG